MKSRIYDLEVTTLLNGQKLVLPVHEFVGEADGPTLGISATLHGDEILPIEILRLFAQEIVDLQFRGKILMLPVANPPALGTFTRNNPIDMLNLNRVFPGSEGGWISEQIAKVITDHYLSEVDCLLDFHSGGAVPTVEYTVCYERGREMGRVFGQKVFYENPNMLPGSLAHYMDKQLGKPVTIIEVGGGGERNDYYIAEGLKGIKNVMKYLQMLNGDPVLPKEQILLRDLCVVRARNGGIFIPKVGLECMNSVFAKGKTIGEIYSPYTFEKLETFTGKYERNLIVLLRAGKCQIESGDYTYMLGNMDTAKIIYND